MRTTRTGTALAALTLTTTLACMGQIIIEANPDPEGTSEGDGDGDLTGDGDGDGDGDLTGDGDGESTASGDGDPTDTGGPSCEASVPVSPPGSCDGLSVVIAPEFASSYSCELLSELPNVPKGWGGLSLTPDDPNRLLLAGAANTANGQLYGIDLTRDADCHITGWSGTAIEVAHEAPYVDGGVAYSPDGVLFLARWPNNEIGQLLPGSASADRVVDLGALSVAGSPGALNFVPSGFPGAGGLKLISWSGGEWYTLQLALHEDGTYELPWASYSSSLPGGPEGFVYVRAGSPGFAADGLLVSEYSAGRLTAYNISESADPILDSRRDFMIGIGGPMGGYLDPLSGDFLFTADDGGDRLIVVRGFSSAEG